MKTILAEGKAKEINGQFSIGKLQMGWWAKWFKSINELQDLEGKQVKLILEVEK